MKKTLQSLLSAAGMPHLLLMVLLWVPWVTQAQTELTVFDGTNTNNNVPVYGYFADATGSAAEIIIPSDELTDMVGGTSPARHLHGMQPSRFIWARCQKPRRVV